MRTDRDGDNRHMVGVRMGTYPVSRWGFLWIDESFASVIGDVSPCETLYFKAE